MSYQVLARKWRPHQFRDVVGQAHVLMALTNALDHNRLHHAYLFSGTRGVGKTTIARIFTKALNCEHGITSVPCGVCSTCQEIDQGCFVDLLEVDAASRTKVEDTRDLLDNVEYKPARGRYKVYLIDEVHMLSRHSFNALLKTLEEPPEYVKFLLATTNPQKLPITILSRCLQFHLKHLDTLQIKHQLEHVLSEECISAELRALSLISRAAEGSMRDALSLTDQAIALGNGAVFESQVTSMLGTLSTDQALLLLEVLACGETSLVMQRVTQIADIGVEWDGLLKEIASQLHCVAMAQALPESMDISSPDAERILLLSKTMPPQDVQLLYQIVLQGRQDLPFAPDGRAGLEMVLLRMLAFRPVVLTHFEPEVIVIPSKEPHNEVTIATMSSTAVSSTSLVVQENIASLKIPVASGRMQTAPVRQKIVSSSTSNQANIISQFALTSHAPKSDQFTEPYPLLLSHMAAMERDVQWKYGLEEEENLKVDLQLNINSRQNISGYSSSALGERLASRNLLAARNMLRSRKRELEGKASKKNSRIIAECHASSVIGRIVAKHKPVDLETLERVDLVTTDVNAKDEAYRWKPTKVDMSVILPTMTSEKFKKVLSHERTSKMREKLEKESIKQNEWCRIVNLLDVPRIVKQMALNTAMEKNGDEIILTLRPEQACLNKKQAKKQLADELNRLIGSSILLSVKLGEHGVTPLEWRDKLYAEKFNQAEKSLNDDSNIHFICQHFSAELDEASIRPI
ncbi:DNA polymerase III subunit gamma/tau [Candidatus Enterovibrio altilux]|uniref:DNA polymerase III subunit gamma/tau n=1 Tax=Candidatus Enterovibrio altilux TaxID=1927128 RepID=UPI001237B1E9|nr:DNA polymerase III subunit gamma/tau [Candidatus Enterovibrio luxaltus]